MDIWNWVEKLRADLREAGQEQSARLIDELTAYVCDPRWSAPRRCCRRSRR